MVIRGTRNLCDGVLDMLNGKDSACRPAGGGVRLRGGLFRRRGTTGILRKGVAALSALSLLLPSAAAFAADVTSYAYDEARPGSVNVGRLTSQSNDAGTIRYDYDARGAVVRQEWEVDGQIYAHGFVHAPGGELVRRSFSDGDTVPSVSESYLYDAYGRLQSIPGYINAITRTASGEPIETVYANGLTETRAYDPNRQWLSSITTTGAAGQAVFTESYTRNAKGLITSVRSNRARGNWDYGYDSVDRLTDITNLDYGSYSQTFAYDAGDNVTHNSLVGTYVYPPAEEPRPHAVSQAGTQAYAYDADGNMVSGGGRTIAYDGDNRPVSITAFGQTVSFVYGPDGARLKKIVGGQTTLYLGADEEITPQGKRIKHAAAEVRKVDGTVNWLHRDHLSSVRLMSDASGTVIEESLFRPYGERSDLQLPLSVPRESKGWIGERDDPETGLTYLNARYYDPVLARFISPDWFEPQEAGVGTNRYAYAGNNPILYKDPSGNFFDTIFDVMFVAADLFFIGRDYVTKGTVDPVDVVALGADLGAIIVPGVTGAGIGVRAAREGGEKIVKSASDKLLDAAKDGGKVAEDVTKKAPDITTPYKRPSGATTKAQRESVQNQPCVDCGNIANRQVADHKTPLVKEYYETGTIDKTNMRSMDAVQPQCPTCSARQGAEMSRYSKQQKKDLGL